MKPVIQQTGLSMLLKAEEYFVNEVLYIKFHQPEFVRLIFCLLEKQQPVNETQQPLCVAVHQG